jgi:hypothetical protein
MSDAFYSTDTLVHDKKFLLSAAVSIVVAAGATLLGLTALERTKITVTPIAAVQFVLPPPTGSAKPISQILDAKDAKIAPGANNVWSGYIVEVNKLCDEPQTDGKHAAVVIMKTNVGFTAGTAQLGSHTCELAKNLKAGEALYAASDTPFVAVPSEKKFVTLDYYVSQ